jgi:hypothetical protein
VIRRVRAVAWFVWKLAAAVLVILMVLFLIGWFVDVVVDPAEEEISAVGWIRAEDA